MRALRLALRLTQEELAERLQAAPNTVRSWERGRHPPGMVFQRALDEALAGASGDERKRFRAAAHEVPALSGQEQQTDRRQALQAIGALLATSHLESLELTRSSEASDLGPTTLDHLNDLVVRLGMDYLHKPPPQMFAEVHRWRQYVNRLLRGRHTLAQRSQLYAVAGWLSALLGHLSYDLGHQATADAHCSAALHLAGEVAHAELTAWVRGSQAMFATFYDRPDAAVALAQAGQQIAPRGSAAAVRLLAQLGRASARTGDRHGATAAMGQAEEAFEQMVDTPNHSIFSFSAPYLPFYAGTSFLWLGQARRAQAVAEQAIVLCDAEPQDWPVARVLARFDLATCFVQQNELEWACSVGGQALTLARQRLTEPVRRQARLLQTALEPYAALAPVRDLGEQFRSLDAQPVRTAPPPPPRGD